MELEAYITQCVEYVVPLGRWDLLSLWIIPGYCWEKFHPEISTNRLLCIVPFFFLNNTIIACIPVLKKLSNIPKLDSWKLLVPVQ